MGDDEEIVTAANDEEEDVPPEPKRPKMDENSRPLTNASFEFNLSKSKGKASKKKIDEKVTSLHDMGFA